MNTAGAKTTAVQQNSSLFHIYCSVIVLASKSIDGPAINIKPISEVELIWRNKWPESSVLYLRICMSGWEEALAKCDANGKLPKAETQSVC